MAEMNAKKKSFQDIIQGEECDSLLELARLTEQAERYEDMCVIMGKIVEKKKELGVEERNMLSVAYKNVVGSRRAAWRALKDEIKNDAGKAKEDYRSVVEAELFAKCKEVLSLLKNNLLKTDDEHDEMKEKVKAARTANQQDDQFDNDHNHKKLVDPLETQVFYLKMSGDYFRYLAEFKQEEEEHKNHAEEKYKAALKLAEILPPTHPTRLGLALNASVCYWEIMKKPKEACDLAKRAFDDAIQKLDSLSDSTYKDSTLIMQLLRDNLTIWTVDDANPQEGTAQENA